MGPYCHNYYGPAAEPTAAYYEAMVAALDAHPQPVFSGGRGVHLVFTPKLADALGRRMDRTLALAKGDALYERRLRGVRAGYEFARRVCHILEVKKARGVTTDIGGTFSGWGTYLKSAEAVHMSEDLVRWVGSLHGRDATVDSRPDPPYFYYVKQNVLENAAFPYRDETRLLEAFEP